MDQNSPRYIFFGTPRFAEIVLGGLIRAQLRPVGLVCNPDRPVGRKQLFTAPPTKKLIAELPDIKIFQPENLAELLTLGPELAEIKPDFFVVAAYAKIIPRAILEIPRLGTLGVHPSILPRYRGASPIQSAILGGELETGTTIYLIDEKTDHGPILVQENLAGYGPNLPIAEVPYLELQEKLAVLGAKLLVECIPDFLDGTLPRQIQDESQATYTKKFKTEDGFVDSEDLDIAISGDTEKANEILRKINALNPEPGVWMMKDGSRIKLLAAKLQNGSLVLTRTQREGEKPFNLDHTY
jgi:methionyl-tRNA formyltransferase